MGSESSLLLNFVLAWAYIVALLGLPVFGPLFALSAFYSASSNWGRFVRNPKALGKLLSAFWWTAVLGLITWAMTWVLMPIYVGTLFKPSAYLPFAGFLTALLLVGCCYGWSNARREPVEPTA